MTVAPALAPAKFGAVSVLHRFGSSLNPHFHYHLCVLDGLFERDEQEEAENSLTAAYGSTRPWL